MVNSVQAYEEAKIRLLNATHSCIAWAGTLAGLPLHPRRHPRRRHPEDGLRLRDRRCDSGASFTRAALPDQPGEVPRRGARPLRQPRHPGHQPARGDGRVFQDSRHDRAHHPRQARPRRLVRQRGHAARAVPGLPAALAPGPDSLHLPGPGDGPGRGARDLRCVRSGRRLRRRHHAVGRNGQPTQNWSTHCARPTPACRLSWRNAPRPDPV